MAYNTKALLQDAHSKPIPQYYNETSDVYEPIEGSNGGMYTVLADVDGIPIPQQIILNSLVTNTNLILAKLDELILVVS